MNIQQSILKSHEAVDVESECVVGFCFHVWMIFDFCDDDCIEGDGECLVEFFITCDVDFRWTSEPVADDNDDACVEISHDIKNFLNFYSRYQMNKCSIPLVTVKDGVIWNIDAWIDGGVWSVLELTYQVPITQRNAILLACMK
jgi:hypothetical protein